MTRRGVLIRAAVALAVFLPLFAAAQSPLLQWRDPIYIAASFAGIVGLALLLVQPLLIAGAFSGFSARRLHIWFGSGLVVAVVLHVAGLWITSPPDVVDVLLFRSPTPFAVWGAMAMWGVFAAALLAAVRRKIGPRFWRLGHSVAVVIIVAGTVVHTWLIDGTMEVVTKAALCLLVLAATAYALRKRRVWRLLR
ncbi:ferric reductase-like transmembrane domain-containing protein [Pseudohoeflea coraliihabitans]|uniref:Ferric reductase-like transmembrane domain-containing protein n=1 Tax=Pseudohoeflea coraliihabitans TaxID=2860393 RepID=A0ABS6WPR7_9HYPH|nr:ferric reductase-like transmembrane domain-containing protein [Pseudohoeflea sp. DP4N28-3]MBW3097957.1 ferric reductase-like transmembrane domain-containing protein [Pseudohoeflea sp. DP4N28-3]